jgi:hypothetical protein
MTKYLLDSMIYDQLLNDRKCYDLIIQKCKEGSIEILITHVQLDQLKATPDLNKRQSLLSIVANIPSRKISTAGAVWGMSKWDEAKWGPGAGDVQISDITNGNLRHNADGLLVATAAAEADVFVTEEKRLPRKVQRLNSKLTVISFRELCRLLHA